MQIYNGSYFYLINFLTPPPTLLKQNDDLAFQVYEEGILATWILKTSYPMNMAGQPCKTLLKVFMQQIKLHCSSWLPSCVLINELKLGTLRLLGDGRGENQTTIVILYIRVLVGWMRTNYIDVWFIVDFIAYEVNEQPCTRVISYDL